MTISEFRAWLDGFSEAFPHGSPTPDQWAKIKAKIDGLTAFAGVPEMPLPAYPQTVGVWQPPPPVSCGGAAADPTVAPRPVSLSDLARRHNAKRPWVSEDLL